MAGLRFDCLYLGTETLVCWFLGGTQQGHHAALRACIDLNGFERLDEGEGAKTSSEIAKMTGADPVLMGMSWQILRIFYSISDTDKLSRTVAEASSCNGQCLRNRPQRIHFNPIFNGPQRPNLLRRLSHYVRAPLCLSQFVFLASLSILGLTLSQI